MILLISLVSCAEDEEIIIEKEHEKTKTMREVSRNNETSKKSDSVKTILQPSKALEPGDSLDPGTGTDPGEVGPVVTTPPK